jgi:hypothetical protein
MKIICNFHNNRRINFMEESITLSDFISITVTAEIYQQYGRQRM